MRRVRYAITAGALAVALTALDAVAQVGGGVLRMSDGATLSTDVDDVFHDIGEEGLTIEGWFYLDRLPAVGEVQTFFSNPGKYALGVGIVEADYDVPGWVDEHYDPRQAHAFSSVRSEQGQGSRGYGIMGDRDDRNPPVRGWFHVAWQFHADPPVAGWQYTHKQAFAIGREDWFPFKLPVGAGALYIATPEVEIGGKGFAVDPDADITIFKGLVDEVRVSSIARYEGRDAVRPRHFTPDAHTIALWTFDGGRPFADKSGNGHDLIHDGAITIAPLAVDAGGNLATTWAGLRRDAR
jgi:hypothetical protein